MDGFGASTYGDGFAEVYDQWYPDVTDTDACVAALADLARLDGGAATGGEPAVLELGVGTGRLALPLAELGLAVTGVDASAAMLARLADKPGADRVTVVVGDLAQLDRLLARPANDQHGFALAFAAYNTLFNLPTVEAQQACLSAVADRLVPGGRLVIEAFVPPDPSPPPGPIDPADFADTGGPGDPTGPGGRRDDVSISRISATELVLSATVHDPDAQTITGQHVQITEAGVKLRPWMVRYLRPDQLDELTTAVGLEREHRWAGWDRAPFDSTSPVHVSVYRRAL